MEAIRESLTNARAMAENLIKCPASEQYLGQTQAAIAQAIRDLANAVEFLLSLLPEDRK